MFYPNSFNDSDYKEFNFIHFNDVYNINSSEVEPVGGAARFVHMVKKLREENKNTLLLFSGDIFSPSVMSTLFKGEHMLPIIDELKIDVACVGNHDYDFGITELSNLVARIKNKFPWLLSNLFSQESNKKTPIAPGTEYHIIEINGIKIGFMGLIELDWILTQNKIKLNDYIYVDYIQKAKELTSYLKFSEKCDLVIALTHMRTHHEEILSEQVPELDLILGGHDHFFFYLANKANLIVKSGTDFRELTFNKVKLFKRKTIENIQDRKFKCYSEKFSENDFLTVIDKEEYTFSVETKLITISRSVPEDEIINNYANFINEKTREKFKIVIGYIATRIDAQFLSVRRKSLPISNFVTDLLRIYMKTDCVILNSGTLRADSYIYEGEITFETLKRLLPGEYNVVRLLIKGDQIVKALENGVSKYPALEGRFPMISGITFDFNPKNPTGNRVISHSVIINGEKLVLDKEYSMATREFLFLGSDGYSDLTKCIEIDENTDITNLFDICLKYFEIVKSLNGDSGCLTESNYLEPGIFGFDTSNNSLINYIRETVIFQNETPQVLISSYPRINILD